MSPALCHNLPQHWQVPEGLEPLFKTGKLPIFQYGRIQELSRLKNR